MKTFESFIKRALCVLFFLFLSSCGCRVPTWYYESECWGSYYRYTKLTYSSANICNNLELEVVRTQDELAMYINILSIPIDDCHDPMHLELVSCRVELMEALTLEFDVIRLEGNQRFLIPEEPRDKILDHLWSGGMLQIHIGRYAGTIDAHNFQKSYRLLLF